MTIYFLITLCLEGTGGSNLVFKKLLEGKIIDGLSFYLNLMPT